MEVWYQYRVRMGSRTRIRIRIRMLSYGYVKGNHGTKEKRKEKNLRPTKGEGRMQERAYGDEDRDDADPNRKTKRASMHCDVLFHKPIKLVQGGLLRYTFFFFFFWCFVFDNC